jgi:tRNA(His) 5'-end guanylyltransferase
MEKIEKSLSLGDRMKIREKKYQMFLSDKDNVVIRLDGDSFSKFTKGFRKPFDSIITKTMLKVSEELFKRFQCSFVYTQSDEITLVIPASANLPLGGKIQKLASLTAGFASTQFNVYLRYFIEEEKYSLEKSFYEKISAKVGKAWFDSRVFAFEDKVEAFNAVLWRMRDAEKNSISMVAYTLFSNSELEFKNGSQKKEMLLEKGISWDNLEPGLKYGFYLKKESYLSGDSKRSKISYFAKKFFFSQENVDLIFSKEVS